MRRLILFRHAKAARLAGGGDHARALEIVGREAAETMGHWLATLPLRPDLALVSDARRTRETWSLAAPFWPGKIPATLEPRIYEASLTTLLHLIATTSDAVETLLMVGHNPGLADLAVGLAGTGATDTLRLLRSTFPTGAMAVLTFDVDHWQAVDWGHGTLTHFATPGLLSANGHDFD